MDFGTLFRLANLLTLLRLFLIPPFIFCFQADMMVPAFAIFGLAALTDNIDGKIARRQGVTNFGKFMDPLADKLLIGAALICLALFEGIGGGLIPMWMVVVIMGREVLVTLLRIVFITKYGQVVSASQWGKYKMTSQLIVIAIGLVLLAVQNEQTATFVLKTRGPIYFMMYLPLVLTVGSGVEFFVNNRKALSALIFSTGYDPEAGA
ncbi:CDP-diacylglycerol--glycerol-3-phosphate 3-phosphatidyltransferase [Candidatus Poribacteria bacterium]|nr:CDP-diacylglycerol--glycerol-3-phosphate 3-phosphatidyltransferase [Candidatus Poribacteria bacterium]MYK21297.1 CDP-diacylglycerol--glycerol-3-phosphate 3-phosphatidyltransferase [Candidatus Poribacteria bacterium]